MLASPFVILLVFLPPSWLPCSKHEVGRPGTGLRCLVSREFLFFPSDALVMAWVSCPFPWPAKSGNSAQPPTSCLNSRTCFSCSNSHTNVDSQSLVTICKVELLVDLGGLLCVIKLNLCPYFSDFSLIFLVNFHIIMTSLCCHVTNLMSQPQWSHDCQAHTPLFLPL